MDLQNVHYDAFISYRHSKLDMEIAKGIHKRLESYRLPKEALSKVANGKKKIERVFRDQDELPLADNLSDPINMALMNSDYLIVICTPRLPESKWCRKEISTFIKCHDRDHVLLVLAEGEPEESFPRELTSIEKTVVGEDGFPHTEYITIEPLAADVRGKNERERAKLMDDATLRLCASIFGLNYDDLRMRHKEQQNKKRLKLFGGIAAFMCLFAAVCLGLLLTINSQKETIASQYSEIQEKYESSMVLSAQQLNEIGHHNDALYALVNAIEGDDCSDSMAESLAATMNVYNPTDSRIPTIEYNTQSEVSFFKLNSDCTRIAIMGTDGTISIFNTETSEPIGTIKLSEEFNSGDDCMNFCGTDSLFYLDHYLLHMYNCTTGKDTTLLSTFSYLIAKNTSPYAFCYSDGLLYAFNPDGSEAFSFNIGELVENYSIFAADASYSFSSDMTKLTALIDIGSYDECALAVVDIPKKELQTLFLAKCSLSSLATAEGDTLYLYTGTARFGDNIGNENLLIAFDVNTLEEKWSVALPTDGYYTQICVKNGLAFLNGSFSGIFIDPENGNILNTVQFSNQALKAGIINETSVLAAYSDASFGYIMNMDDVVSADASASYYYISPKMNVNDIATGFGNVYLAPSTSKYVVRYSSRPFGKLIAENTDYDYDANAAVPILSEDPSDKTVIKSDDGKYTFRQSFDGSVRIIDSEGNVVSIIYDLTEKLKNIAYIDEIDKYVINCSYSSYLLGDELQIVASLYPFIGYENGELICHCDKNDYSLPYHTKKDLISMAREELGSYVPSEEIKARYGIR